MLLKTPKWILESIIEARENILQWPWYLQQGLDIDKIKEEIAELKERLNE